VTIAEFLNVVLPSPEVDVGVTAKTEPFTLGDCRPDYKEPLIIPADVAKALCVLLAMAPFFWEAWKMFVSMCSGCGLEPGPTSQHSLINRRIGLATSSNSSIISADDAGWTK